jgi:polyhydroxybutyrate depolymerase
LANQGFELGPIGYFSADPFRCELTRPVPVFHVHGKADRLMQYDGVPALGFPSVDSTIEDWELRNGIAGAESVMSYNGTGALGSTTCTTKGEADREATLCTHEGGHIWGSLYGMDVSQRIWDFFATKSL